MIQSRFYPVCLSYTSALTMENYPDNYDKSSLQVVGGALQSQMDRPNPWLGSSIQLLMHPSHVQY